MANTYSYQVITLKQAALLIGNSWLTSQLAKLFAQQNIQVFYHPQDISDEFSLDYLLIGHSKKDLDWDFIERIIQRHSPNSIYLSHLNSPLNFRLPEQISHWQYVDCFGSNFTLAPNLSSLINEAVHQKTITLPKDGLSSYPLMCSDDLVKALFLILTHPSHDSAKIIAPPTSISLLSLAYLIRSQFNHQVKLKFDPSLAPPHNPPPEKIALLPNWYPTSNINQPLAKFIQNYLTQSTPSAVSQPHTTPQILPSNPTSSFNRGRAVVSLSSKHHLSKLSDIIKTTTLKKSKSPSNKQTSGLAFVPITTQSKKIQIPKFKLPHISPPKPISIIGGGLAFALLIYLLLIVTSLTFTALTIKSLRKTLTNNSIPPSKSLTIAKIPAVFIEANLVAVSSLPVTKNSSFLTQLTSLSTYYRHGLDSLLLAQDFAQTASKLFEYVLGGGEGDVVSLINQSRLLSSELYESLSLLEGSLPSKPLNIIPQSKADLYLTFKQNLQTLRATILTAKTLLATAPDFLGVGGRRKYLVLFQNNMELRPTGGFIGAFALMSFENGKLYDMPIFDVYSADGQLKGHVEPPKEIKTYLGEANWYLRDSNWDPDFPTSARRAEWFLDKTIDQQVQGTIAINVNTLANLLEALGSVNIPDYDEDITANNIFEKAEYYSEVNFFPGSNQKKEFLSSVADAIFNRLTNLKIEQSLPIAQALAKSIDEKNTLLAIDSPTTNHTFSVLGWNGELSQPDCPNLSNTCYLDYAMLVDANLGVNKANYFLNRSINLVTTLDKQLIPQHILKIAYQNTSTSNSWPAGNYKNYSRLYLPPDTIFDSLSIGGKLIDHKNISLSAEHDRLVVGFLLNVPINSTLEVELSYHRASSLDKNNPTYSFYWQKQPGTNGDPLHISLNHPLYLKPDIVSPRAEVLPQQLNFSLSNITDRRLSVKFLSN